MNNMVIDKNTPKLWDTIWVPSLDKEEKFRLEVEKKSIQWKRIKEKVLNEFGSFKNLKSIEIGAGQGNYSLLFALEGAKVTVLDYSPKAIESSKRFFKKNKMKANFIQMDALNLDKRLLSKFNVSMSFGTAEHFSGEKRIKFIKSHFDILKKDGITFISVPNKWDFRYRVWKFLSESFNRWKFGEEYPFSIREFKKIGKEIGKKFEFIGAYLFNTPFLFLLRIKKLFRIEYYNTKNIKQQIGTVFDKYFSQFIVAVGKKN